MDNIPALRFSEFSGDWEKKKFLDVTEILRCGIASTPTYVEKGVPFLSAQNVSSNGNIILDKYNFISEEYYKKLSKNHELKSGDLLYSRVGASFGNAGVFELEGNHGVYVSLTHIRPRKVLNNFFLKYFLNSDFGKKQAKKGVVQGGGVPNLNVKVVEKFNIPLPTIDEQQKIAAFLTQVDNKIEQLTQKKQLLADYKKGVMQQIFSQEIRFKQDDGSDYPDWEVKKLGDVGEFKGGGTPSRIISDYWIGDIPWISSSDISEGDIHNIKLGNFINEISIKESATKIIPKNSVLFISRVGVGKLAINKIPLCTSQDFMSFIPNECDSYFLGYLFLEKKNVLLSFSQGTSIKGFTKNDIEALKINLPIKNEQQKIANFLTEIDTKINQVEKQLSDTQQFKSGLLQQMFV